MVTETTTNGYTFQTVGDFADEDAAKADFDRRYSEVEGCYVQPRHGTDDKAPRIDRLLIPTRALIEDGWTYGIIGVECKQSGRKLGPLISQCLDYSRAVYTLRDSKFAVMCSWIFMWPTDSVVGDLASVMDQNRIGCAIWRPGDTLQLKTGSCNMLWAKPNDRPEVGKVRCGAKVGSR
jgi:hypothetical protein